MTTNYTVTGLQWGDEGKGKVVDRLAPLCRYVIRYCGGANAGHTVVVGDERFAMHLIPCGILHEGVVNVIGNGVVFDPEVAAKEVEGLRARGVKVGSENLRISAAAHVVMPWHKLQDRLSEQALGGGRIGTTARGIGPCYADKASRSTAIRAGELADAEGLARRIRHVGGLKNRLFAALYDAEPMDLEAVVAQYVELGRFFADMIANTGALLRRALAKGERILFEGGQGSMLDVDHGTYPFVTSSSVTACGVPAGAGVPPSAVGRVIGVAKSYSTRVGSGPFPTEQDNPIGDAIRERGREYGTTTGRPRRCGWLDVFAVRCAAQLNGASEIALALLDVLTGLDEVKICTGYTVGGRRLEDYDPALLAEAECLYETLPGWRQELGGCRQFEEMPPAARSYVRRVEELVGLPVGLVGVGPKRDDLIVHHTALGELIEPR